MLARGVGGPFDFCDKVSQGVGGIFLDCDVTFLLNYSIFSKIDAFLLKVETFLFK